MPTTYSPNATYWIKVPAKLQGNDKPYYYALNGQSSFAEKPPVPWDHLWDLNLTQAGRPYYHNQVSGQTVWEIPGVVRDKVGLWDIHRGSKPGEWEFEMAIPFPEYEAQLYDPDISCRAVSARLREAAQETSDGAAAGKDMWIVKVSSFPRRGRMQTAYAWNRSSGEVTKAPPPGAMPAWTAYPTMVDAAGITWATEYYVDHLGRTQWTLPDLLDKAGEEAAREEDMLPRWMCPGSLVRLARLPAPLRRLEGMCGTVEHIDAGKVRLRLPDFFGPDYYDVEPTWVSPLRPGTRAYLARMRPDQQHRAEERITVHDFDPLLHTYTVRAYDGEELNVHSWQLQPCYPLMDVQLKQPVKELAWRRNPEQHATFTDHAGNMHKCAVHLPLGWDRWILSKDRSPWPLLVYLHGGGGTGTMFHVTKKSVTSPGLTFAAENFVVVSPECLWDWKQDPLAWVVELVDVFRACQWIDADRIYLSGISMGGMSTWMIGAQRPDLFAAIAPIAAYHKLDLEDFIATRLARMPILVAASVADVSCPFNQEVRLYRRLLSSGCSTLQVFLHKTAGHDRMRQKAYCDTDFLYQWLLAHCK